jgi:hypothetical protein
MILEVMKWRVLIYLTSGEILSTWLLLLFDAGGHVEI